MVQESAQRVAGRYIQKSSGILEYPPKLEASVWKWVRERYASHVLIHVEEQLKPVNEWKETQQDELVKYRNRLRAAPGKIKGLAVGAVYRMDFDTIEKWAFGIKRIPDEDGQAMYVSGSNDGAGIDWDGRYPLTLKDALDFAKEQIQGELQMIENTQGPLGITALVDMQRLKTECLKYTSGSERIPQSGTKKPFPVDLAGWKYLPQVQNPPNPLPQVLDVVLIPDPRTGWLGQWDSSTMRMRVTTPLISPVNVSHFVKDLDLIEETLEHEMRHLAQTYLSWGKGMPDQSAGMPPQSVRPSKPETDALPRDTLYPDRPQHALDDVEFYSRLGDDVRTFLGVIRKYPQSSWRWALREWVGIPQPVWLDQLGRQNIPSSVHLFSDFFRSLKKYEPKKWKKAVLEFTKLVSQKIDFPADDNDINTNILVERLNLPTKVNPYGKSPRGYWDARVREVYKDIPSGYGPERDRAENEIWPQVKKEYRQFIDKLSPAQLLKHKQKVQKPGGMTFEYYLTPRWERFNGKNTLEEPKYDHSGKTLFPEHPKLKGLVQRVAGRYLQQCLAGVVGRSGKKGAEYKLNTDTIARMRKDFLGVMGRVSGVRSFDDAQELTRLCSAWANSFDNILVQIRGNLEASLRQHPDDSQLKSLSKHFLDNSKNLWAFSNEMGSNFQSELDRLAYSLEWQHKTYPDDRNGDSDAQIFQRWLSKRAIPRWEGRVKQKARLAWKWFTEFALWSEHAGVDGDNVAQFQVPSRETTTIEGFPVRIIGWEGSDIQEEGLAKLKEGLRFYRQRASVFPWLLQNQLPLDLDLSDTSGGTGMGFAGRYHGKKIELSIWAIHSKPREFAGILAHEMGHHYYKTQLSDEAQNDWYRAIHGGDTTLDLRDVLKQMRPDDTAWDFRRRIEEEDPILSLQIETLTHNPEYKHLDLWDVSTFKEYLDKGGEPVLRVPLKPITGYAAKNPEEAFCEALKLLVAYGPRTLLPEIVQQVRVLAPGIKVAQKQVVARPVQPVDRSKTYYHGTSKIQDATKIMREGLVPPELNGRKDFLTPVQGKVYLTSKLEYAMIYALGGDVAGHDSGHMFRDENFYGYLFVIPGENLADDIQPDEDFVGEQVGNALNNDANMDPQLRTWLKNYALTLLTENQIRKVKEGEYIYYAAAGKKLLKKLPPKVIDALIDAGAAIAHTGKVMPTEVWRIDRRRSIELKRDGSNFFKIAERVKGL